MSTRKWSSGSLGLRWACQYQRTMEEVKEIQGQAGASGTMVLYGLVRIVEGLGNDGSPSADVSATETLLAVMTNSVEETYPCFSLDVARIIDN